MNILTARLERSCVSITFNIHLQYSSARFVQMFKFINTVSFHYKIISQQSLVSAKKERKMPIISKNMFSNKTMF